jgi:hypothetical protein
MVGAGTLEEVQLPTARLPPSMPESTPGARKDAPEAAFETNVTVGAWARTTAATENASSAVRMAY